VFFLDALRANCRYVSIQCSPLAKERCFPEFSVLRPLVLLVRAVCRYRWIWSIGGMIVTGGNGTKKIELNYI
jgi:hypothetical protein